jgi:dihydrofolate reductase
MGERMAAGGGLAGWLFGRRTYEQLLASWNARGGPFKDALNNTPKYVASATLEEPLPWPNSTLLRGDIADAVRALKAQSGGVQAIMGSGVLIGPLMAANLIDEYLLMIHPLVPGTGRRLFPGGRGTVAAAYPQHHHPRGRGDRHLRASQGRNVRQDQYKDCSRTGQAAPGGLQA